jgi:signal transduction histidine kinase
VSVPPEAQRSGLVRFRTTLLIAMMVVVSAITGLALYFAQRHVVLETKQDLQREFQGELAALHNAQEIRHAALVERCRALVGKARIHAALEDNALDLLYLSAQDELRDVMVAEEEKSAEHPGHFLRARFYRFLDANGAVITPVNSKPFGALQPAEEAQLTLPVVPDRQQLGYLLRKEEGAGETIDEIIAMPIISNETGAVIAAIVMGFKPVELGGKSMGRGMKSGIWLNDRLHLPTVTGPAQLAIGREISRSLVTQNKAESSFGMEVDGARHLLFYKRLNPGSLFPAAHEVCLYPLAESLARQRQLRWQVVGAGALLLLGGLGASHFISGRLAVPVEKLAVDSAEDRVQRARAEAALESTSEELQRAARFSADASHQLKTPVTVLRAGLEEFLAREQLTPEARDEISALIHQTYRITNVIEDLLLLSRMDAGRLQLELSPVNLTLLIEAWLDDLSALPDKLDLKVETELAPGVHIAGEKRYTTLIVQNLLENARKYNRPGGRIRIAAREEGEWLLLTIGNTSRPIAPAAREHIFERFHRGASGENVPGYGLGLNLARELARIHHGDLRLTGSDDGWTEFEVRFRLARPDTSAARQFA